MSNVAHTILVLLSVLMICAGQLLFKLVGLRIQSVGNVLDVRVWGVGFIAISIYGAATLIWIYVLRTMPLTKAYPYMALSFVLVPLFGVLLFSEQVRPMYLLGSGLIVLGVIVTTIWGGG